VARQLKAPVTVAGWELERGTTVAPCIYLAHQRPELYPEPNLFKPERFFDSAFTPYQYLPFGGGARRCIGMSLALWEMKVVLATLVPAYRLVTVDPQPVRAQRRSVTVAPAGGPPMRVHALEA
jgi:cytochrome P450